MCAIESGRVCPCKEMLYRTAVVSSCLAECLRSCPCEAARRIDAGTVVAIRFAWHSLSGEAVYYFGLDSGHWVGVTHECGLERLCL